MSDEKTVFSCPHCGRRLKVPAIARKVRCSQCKKIVDRKLLAVDESLTPSLAKAATPRAVKPPKLPESLGFLSYCWRSYTETHTSLPWLFGMILGGILIAALSFSKPSIGTQLILGSFLLMALIAFLSFAVLSSVACVNYLFRRQRHVPDDRTTWLSATACFSLTLSLALAICSVAEFFGPNKGILVTLVPQLEKEQARVFPDTTAQQPETESLPSNIGDHDVTDSVVEDSSDSPVFEASELSESEPVRASEPASIREMSADSDNEPSPKRNTPDSSPELAQVGDEAQSTSRSDQPKTSKPADSNSTAETQPGITEGVGATADEAIKDAFRHAVRQVVGAVVDAETLIENDEIIDDKVLTYSDGFIKSYEEVAGSKKVKDGLHRIKIKAQVERRSVIARLKAANVTVKEIDGKGLFAEAVTQLNAEKDAAALLTKQFEGFPQSCITATIIGLPEIVTKTEEKATVRLTVQIEPDLKAYKAFADRLISILDKLATSKGEFTAQFREYKEVATPSNVVPGSRMVPATIHSIPWHEEGSARVESTFPAWLNKIVPYSTEPTRLDATVLAVAVGRTPKGDRIDYRYYVVDTSLRSVLLGLATRGGEAEMQLLDDSREVVRTERFRTDSLVFGASTQLILRLSGDKRMEPMERDQYASVAKIFFVNNVFYYGEKSNCAFFQRPVLSLPVVLNLSLDELKSVKDAKVEITFDE